MKWVFAMLLGAAIAVAAMTIPPRTAARMAAHGMRAGWDWLAALGHHEATPEPPRAPLRQMSRRARASREGIEKQPPKEHLEHRDRAALDALVSRSH